MLTEKVRITVLLEGNIVAIMLHGLHFDLLYVSKKLGIYDYLEVLRDSG